MGMPACRITDSTAHGGVIILGFPQVLIGMMPASRIGDMHVCPMVDVLVPHVGGPFILGSPTVLVGMMPQSRVTDTLVCVGPPDIAILGEETVLVGMAGAGGAAGASSGAAAAGSPPAPVAPAAAAAAAAQPKAQAQADGTVKTSAAAPDQALPPMQLQQAGWPDLPPENTATFSSVQPATVQAGTTLYTAADGDADPSGDNASYWSTAPPLPPALPPAPPAGDAGPSSPADWNSASHVLVKKVPPGDGVKVWAGKAADAATDALQVWAPPGALSSAPAQRFRLPGHGK